MAYSVAGQTPHFIVQYDSSLGTGGAPTAAPALLESCEADDARLKAWFGGIDLPKRIALQLEAGKLDGKYCGATNNESDLVQMYCSENQPSVAQSDSVAELAEIFMFVQQKGWRGLNSKGEALSRFLAEVAYPSQGGLASDEKDWLDSSREDFLTKNDNNIFVIASPASGCALLFINYLRSQLGFSLTAIITVGGDLLNDVYRNLTHDPVSPFQTFSGLLAAKFLPGQPIFVENDDPFPIPNERRLSLRRFLETLGTPHPSVRDLVAQANVGNVRALVNTERPHALF